MCCEAKFVGGALALLVALACACAANSQELAALPSAAGVESRFYVFGESLSIWPRRDNLQTAIVPGAGAEPLSGSGTPGVRVGGGYRVFDTAWDLGATFTYFHAKSQRTVAAPDGTGLIPVLTANPAARNAGDADGDAGLSYSVLDLDVGNSCYNDNVCSLRLFGGVRLASIDQALKCIYSGGALNDGYDFVNSPVRFRGAGLTGGAEGNWDIYNGWGLFGKGRLALLAGQFTSQRSETLDAITISNTANTYDSIVPVAELGVGLRYQGARFFFSAGYEFTNWFNMVNALTPDLVSGQIVRRQGSLTLQAIALKLGVSF